MNSVGLVIASAAFTFTVTNIDVFCLLIVFFANVKIDPDCTNANVWIAQAIGFSLIVGVSLLGALLGASIDSKYVSLLGFIPILLGLKIMLRDWNWSYLSGWLFFAPEVMEANNDRPGEVEMTEIGKITDPETAVDLTENSEESGELDCVGSENSESSDHSAKESECLWSALLSRYIPAQLLEMVLITLANGGENIAVYLPYFAVCTIEELLITLAVYYVLLICFLVAAYCLLGNKMVIDYLHKYGHYVVPVSLVAVGVYILTESILFEL